MRNVFEDEAVVSRLMIRALRSDRLVLARTEGKSEEASGFEAGIAEGLNRRKQRERRKRLGSGAE